MNIKRIFRAIKEPKRILKYLLIKTTRFYPDELYLKLLFPLRTGYKLNLKNPQTFNEKLQWLKLNNRKPEMVKMVDKVDAKEYVASIIGEEYIIPTLGVYNSVDEIDFDKLPNQFVLKCTHDSGGIVICSDKAKLDIEAAKAKLRRGLKVNYYYQNREWPYKQVKPRIIAEELLEEPNKTSPDDYKVMCFDGKVKLIEYHVGRYSEHHTQDFYDRDWNKTAITQGAYGEFSEEAAPRPALLEEMIRLSEILAEGIPHCRVDWYLVNNKLYFGEITFYDASGCCPFDKYEDDLLLGSWITLPEKTV